MWDITEALIRHIADKVIGGLRIAYGDIEIDLEKPFERISMVEAVKKYSGVDFNNIDNLEAARIIAQEHHIEYEERHGLGDIINLFFESYCEEKLIQPTFVMNHPTDISPLAKKLAKDPRFTELFDAVIMGREHANAFSEA